MAEAKSKQNQKGGDGSTNYQAETINVNTTINSDQKIAVMNKLVCQYNEEKGKEGNAEFNGYVRKLEKYTKLVDGELRDLTQKLKDGGFENDVEWALELKEEYFMLLQENKFSKATQNIHACLLAWVSVFFNQFVVDAIKNKLPKEAIKQLLVDKVIAPVEQIVGGENNVLELYSDDITGMIYYLTGNCHLKWD